MSNREQILESKQFKTMPPQFLMGIRDYTDNILHLNAALHKKPKPIPIKLGHHIDKIYQCGGKQDLIRLRAELDKLYPPLQVLDAVRVGKNGNVKRVIAINNNDITITSQTMPVWAEDRETYDRYLLKKVGCYLQHSRLLLKYYQLIED